jgi:hypothetical protein
MLSVATRGVSSKTRNARISFILRVILRERCGPTEDGSEWTNNQGDVCSLGGGMACECDVGHMAGVCLLL